jgi:hypothetical protein
MPSPPAPYEFDVELQDSSSCVWNFTHMSKKTHPGEIAARLRVDLEQETVRAHGTIR